MNQLRSLVAVSALVFSGATSVAGESPNAVEPESVSLGRPVDFVQDIHPILQANCIACHNIAIDEGDLSLENVADILKGGSSGPAIVPGQPEESLLLAVVSQNSDTIMPPPENDVEAKPLTPRELGLLRQWILEGAGKGSSSAGSMIDWRSITDQFVSIGSVDLSTHGRFAAVARGNQVEVYDLVLDVPVERLIDPNLAALGEGEQRLYPQGAADRDVVHAVAFDPQGTTLATAGYRAVKLWKRQHVGQSTPLKLDNAVLAATSRNGSLLAVASQHEVHRIEKDGTTATESWTSPSPIIAIATAGDGRIGVACDNGAVYVWQAGQQEPGHRWQASSAAITLTFTRDHIVTGHGDGTLRLWSAAGENPQQEWKAHATGIRHVHAVSAEGQTSLVAVSRDRVVNVWSSDGREKKREFVLPSETAVVAFSPDGRLIASGDRSGALTIRQIIDGAIVGEHRAGIDLQRKKVRAADTRAWRSRLADVAQARLAAADSALADRETILQKAIEARDAARSEVATAQEADRQATMALQAVREQITDDMQDATAETMASLEMAEARAKESRNQLMKAEESLRSAESAIQLAETAVASMREQQTARQNERQSADVALKAAEQELQTATSELEPEIEITGLAFTGNGSRLVVATSRGTFETVSPTGAPLDVFEAPPATALTSGFGDQVFAVDATGNAYRYSTAGRWDYTGVLGPPTEAPLDLSQSAFVDRVLSLAFSPDGRLLVTGGGEPSRSGELMLWHIDNGQHVATIDGAHSDTIQSVDVSRDGRLIATASADKFAKLFDLQSYAHVRTFEGHTNHVTGVSISDDATVVATASADNSVKVWDAVTGEQSKTIPGFGKPVTAIEHVGLTAELLTSCGDKLVRRHSAESGQQLQAFSGAADYVQSVAACAETSIVAAGGEDGMLFLWNAANGELLRRIEPVPRGEAGVGTSHDSTVAIPQSAP